MVRDARVCVCGSGTETNFENRILTHQQTPWTRSLKIVMSPTNLREFGNELDDYFLRCRVLTRWYVDGVDAMIVLMTCWCGCDDELTTVLMCWCVDWQREFILTWCVGCSFSSATVFSGAITFAVVSNGFRESLEKNDRKDFTINARAANPLSFLRLFSAGPSLSRLSLVLALHAFPMFMGTVPQIYAQDARNWGPTEISKFQSVLGVAGKTTVSSFCRSLMIFGHENFPWNESTKRRARGVSCRQFIL